MSPEEYAREVSRSFWAVTLKGAGPLEHHKTFNTADEALAYLTEETEDWHPSHRLTITLDYMPERPL